MIETDVLIVGCGPAGLTAATALARSGVRALAVSKHSQLAPTPRAHVTNQRTFEILRDFGLEEQAMALATPYSRMPNQIFLRSLVGPEYGRIRGLLLDDSRNREASPCKIADLPQHLLEPLLFQEAVKSGAHIRFSTELTSFTQDDAGVTAQLTDRLIDESLTVRAQYLIGADGGRSLVAEQIGLPFTGAGRIGASLNILFEADLSHWVAHRPGLLYFIVRTPQDEGGAGLGILRCIKPWSSWLMIKGYAAGEETPKLTLDESTHVVRDYLGIPDLELKVTGVDSWDLNSFRATTYQQGRVFCAGDAVHRHPPSNGLGSNTAIQDAYNLAWKLNLVLEGVADPCLLDSYSEERVPVGALVVNRATKSLESYAPVIEAISALHVTVNGSNRAETAFVNESEAAKRNALHASVHEKIYEFQTRGVELNQLYSSSAIIAERQPASEPSSDSELFYRQTAMPGAKLPHAWVQRNGREISTLDLVSKGRFTLLTGAGGEVWTAAADAAAAKFGLELPVIAIGTGCEIEDLNFSWVERRGISDDGCLLVRPDGYIAWRALSGKTTDAKEKLMHALKLILR